MTLTPKLRKAHRQSSLIAQTPQESKTNPQSQPDQELPVFDEAILNAYRLKNYQRCIKLIEKILKFSQPETSTHYMILLAASHTMTGKNFKKSHQILDEVLRLQPLNSFALYGKGVAFYFAGQFEGSLRYLDLAIEADEAGMARAKTLRIQVENEMRKVSVLLERIDVKVCDDYEENIESFVVSKGCDDENFNENGVSNSLNGSTGTRDLKIDEKSKNLNEDHRESSETFQNDKDLSISEQKSVKIDQKLPKLDENHQKPSMKLANNQKSLNPVRKSSKTHKTTQSPSVKSDDGKLSKVSQGLSQKDERSSKTKNSKLENSPLIETSKGSTKTPQKSENSVDFAMETDEKLKPEESKKLSVDFDAEAQNQDQKGEGSSRKFSLINPESDLDKNLQKLNEDTEIDGNLPENGPTSDEKDLRIENPSKSDGNKPECDKNQSTDGKLIEGLTNSSKNHEKHQKIEENQSKTDNSDENLSKDSKQDENPYKIHSHSHSSPNKSKNHREKLTADLNSANLKDSALLDQSDSQADLNSSRITDDIDATLEAIHTESVDEIDASFNESTVSQMSRGKKSSKKSRKSVKSTPRRLIESPSSKSHENSSKIDETPADHDSQPLSDLLKPTISSSSTVSNASNVSISNSIAQQHFTKGLDLYMTGDLSRSIKHFSRALKLESDFEEADEMITKAQELLELTDVAEMNMSEKNYMAVVEILSQALEIDENNDLVNRNFFFQRGLAYFHLNENENSVKDYEEYARLSGKLGLKVQSVG